MAQDVKPKKFPYNCTHTFTKSNIIWSEQSNLLSRELAAGLLTSTIPRSAYLEIGNTCKQDSYPLLKGTRRCYFNRQLCSTDLLFHIVVATQIQKGCNYPRVKSKPTHCVLGFSQALLQGDILLLQGDIAFFQQNLA